MYGIEEIAVLNLLFSCWVQGFVMEDSYEDYFAGEIFIYQLDILKNNLIKIIFNTYGFLVQRYVVINDT